MKNIKKILCFLLFVLIIPLTGCDFSNGGKHKLNIIDLNNIILNIDEICEPNQTYGLYREGDEITFEIKFFSGLSATLLVDGTVYRPTFVEAWEPEYIKYTMPDYDVDVASMINGCVGDELKLCETIGWGSKITDESLDYIDVQRIYLGVAPKNRYGESARIYNEGNKFSEWFNRTLIREKTNDIDGGQGYIVSFNLKDKTSYELEIRNNYVQINSKSYWLSTGLPYAITSFDGKQIQPTEIFKLNIIDSNNFIYDKPEEQCSYFAPGTIIKLHSYPIMDVDLIMYVNGEFHSKQTSIETDDGYIWEYSFVMPTGEAILEFSTDPFHADKYYYYFADIFNWVSLLNETTLKAIEIEDGYIGVDPNDPNNAPIIRYSEKIEDINYNLHFLENEPLVKMHNYEPVAGGWYRKVKYITFEGQEYMLEISNGIVFWNDFSSYEYFRFDRTPTNYPDIITESN